jgi:outer membrane biosynthesis protein TonB
MARPTKALVLSTALHVGLVLALLATIPRNGEPARVSTPRMLSAKLVTLRESGTAAGERNAGGAADDAPEVAAPNEPAPATPPTDRRSAELPKTPRQPVSAPPEPPSAAPAEPPARARTVPEPPPPPELAPIAPPVSASIALTDPAPLERRSDAHSAEAIAPLPASETIPDAERGMLERKIAAFAQRFDASAEDGPSVAWTDDGRDYRATFTRLPAGDSMSTDRLLVTVSTEQDGSRWSTRVEMNRLAFSSFAQFVDRWDPSVQIHDDVIDGRFHSNSEIVVTSDGGIAPTFRGRVTTAQTVDTSRSKRRVRRDDVFLGGLETRVGRIPLPRRFAELEQAEAVDEARIVRLEDDTRITFYADGSVGSRPLESAMPERRVALTDEPHYLLGGDKATLYVHGTVNGKVLVYSPASIVIDDDLVYAVDPRAPGADSDDYLGLVAEKDVSIAGPDTTGPGDVTVHASIYARRRFLVERYTSGGRATLTIFGSVAAGSVSATEPRFRTELVYDPRLEHLRPPSFPLTNRYEIAAWDGRWTGER